MRLGRWRLISRLGDGGNGVVWLASDDSGRRVAVKLLRRGNGDRLRRFVAEISFLRSFSSLDGVLPLLDSELPAEPKRPAWYAMPVATPISTALGPDPAPELVVEAVAAVATTLVRLHAAEVGHRDLKPQNLFERDGEWLIGDFGLVRYPQKEPLTEHGRRLGPVDYMAPEMRDNADRASPFPADVYSLAKTTWTLLTGASLPLPGPHRPDDEAYSLRVRLAYDRAAELDRLLEKATRHDPDARPTMEGFARELAACLEPPPELAPARDRSALVDRISALTASSRQRENAARAKRELFNAAEYELRETALAPVYHEVTNSLSGFRSIYTENRQAAIAVMPISRGHYGELGWAGVLVSEGRELPITVTLSTAVRLRGNEETLDLVGLIVVERASHELPDRHVLCEVYECAPLGSAQQRTAIARIAVAFEEAVDEVLARVAALLAGPNEPLDPEHLSKWVEIRLAALRGVRGEVGNEPRLVLMLQARRPTAGLSVELWNADTMRCLLRQELPELPRGSTRHVHTLQAAVEPGQYVIYLRDESLACLSRRVAYIPSDAE